MLVALITAPTFLGYPLICSNFTSCNHATCADYRVNQRTGPKRTAKHPRAEYQAEWRRAKRHE
jgi:hypothetical protein